MTTGLEPIVVLSPVTGTIHVSGTAHCEVSARLDTRFLESPVSVGFGPVRSESRGVSSALLAALELPRTLGPQVAIPVVGSMSIEDLVARRLDAAVPVQIGPHRVAMTVGVDADWERHLTLWPEGRPDAAVTRSFHELAEGVSLPLERGQLTIRESDGALGFESGDGAQASLAVNALFDGLYRRSAQIVFADAVNYSVIRNTDPETGERGIMLLRLSHDDIYYFSARTDAELSGDPLWFVAINGVLYGMMLDGEKLLFVSKKLDPSARLLAARAVDSG